MPMVVSRLVGRFRCQSEIMALKILPRLFIGSSSESLPIVEILAGELKDVADVVPWTDPRTFPPTEFFATSLPRAASTFDFGVFLFEPDDVVQSRERTTSVPRRQCRI